MNNYSKQFDIDIAEDSPFIQADELHRQIESLSGIEDVRVDTEKRRITFRTRAGEKYSDDINQVLDELNRLGLKMKITHESVEIFNMHCAGCTATIENGLKKIPGIIDARINFATQTGEIDFLENFYSHKSLVGDIKEIGYQAALLDSEVDESLRGQKYRWELIIAIICSSLIFALHFGQHILNLFSLPFSVAVIIQLILVLPVMYSGRIFFIDAYNQLLHKRANMNSLIALGSGSALVYSLFVGLRYFLDGNTEPMPVYFETTAMIITFIMIGRYLEEKATHEARDAALGMASLLPRTVIRIEESGDEKKIPLDELIIGDTVLIRAGQSIPADGVIITGEATIDESLLTGESLPVDKKAADNVIGGTVNTTGGFKMMVTKAGNGTVLDRMIHLVREAQGKKAPIQKMADKVAGIFVPIIIVISFLTLVVWLLLKPGSVMALTAPVAVLLVACPCALGLATPTAILVATGRAARLGVLFRDGNVLERFSKANCFIFDKTGTLTKGHPIVEKVTVAETVGERGLSEQELIQWAASAEQFSEHPLAQAIRERARKDGSKLIEPEDHTYLPGQGISSLIKGRKVIVGKLEYLIEQGMPEGIADQFKKSDDNQGSSVIHVAVDIEYKGSIILSDAVKKDAPEVISYLKDLHNEVILLTGDNYKSARAAAAKIGISHVEAEAKPKTKLATIETLKRTGYVTAMVGDGVNDAAALVAADIGVSLGTGTDIAVKSSDITITGKSLKAILTAYEISKSTLRIIKQNLFWAFFYNIIMIPIAAGILYPFGISMSPIFAAVAMALSSIFVVTNSLRLKKLKPILKESVSS
ncbi:MAG: heavy metal translocating P-type ATPase [candidate division Zixibacteria bacterium]